MKMEGPMERGTRSAKNFKAAVVITLRTMSFFNVPKAEMSTQDCETDLDDDSPVLQHTCGATETTNLVNMPQRMLMSANGYV